MRDDRLRRGAALLACTASVLAGCDSGAGFGFWSLVDLLLPASGAESTEAPSEQRPAGSQASSLAEGDATRVYYQFIDERGRVRFVESLDAVPAEWRDRVGFVESSTPPPMSPEDMKRATAARYSKLRATDPQSARTAPAILMYGADWCPACRKAKKYMDAKGIAYEERNVDDPEIAQELARKSGGRGIPVFDIGGSILRGFSPKALDEMIRSKS